MRADEWLEGVDAVLFDMDDTLVRTGPIGPAVFAGLREESGGRSDGSSFMRAWTRAEGAPSMHDVGAELGMDPDAFVGEFFRRYRAAIVAAPVLDGAGRLISELDRRVAIVTGADRAQAEALVAAKGWLGHVDGLFTFDDYLMAKPHPAGYLLAADALGVRPERCVAVEDSTVGVASAKAAGIRCVGVMTGISGDSLNDADLVVESLLELPLA